MNVSKMWEGIIVVFCVSCIFALEAINMVFLKHNGTVLTVAMTSIAACGGYIFAKYARRD